MQPLTICANDFRALEKMRFCPSGVCLLTGPNGAGKTTVLSALRFLCRVFTRGMEDGISSIGGSSYLKRRGASPEAPVHFELQLGPIRWTLDLPVDARGLVSVYGETLHYGDELILRAEMFKDEWYYKGISKKFDDRRCCAKWVWDHEEYEWMRPFVDLLGRIRVYDSYWMNQVRGPGVPGDHAAFLNATGRNLWTVLHAWKSSPRKFRDQFAWVLSAMREAFPEVVGDLEFDGQPPHGFVIAPGAQADMEGLPGFLQADGVLTGFLHLTAVAGAPPRSILAFDEMENQLHPFAIRSILSSMRARAEQEELTIILTTHSPVLMNAFENEEDQVYVLEQKPEAQPVRLSDMHDAAWFTAFSLGRRYERGDFATQQAGRGR